MSETHKTTCLISDKVAFHLLLLRKFSQYWYFSGSWLEVYLSSQAPVPQKEKNLLQITSKSGPQKNILTFTLLVRMLNQFYYVYRKLIYVYGPALLESGNSLCSCWMKHYAWTRYVFIMCSAFLFAIVVLKEL